MGELSSNGRLWVLIVAMVAISTLANTYFIPVLIPLPFGITFITYFGAYLPLLLALGKGAKVGVPAMLVAMLPTIMVVKHPVWLLQNTSWALLAALLVRRLRPFWAGLLGFVPISFPIIQYVGLRSIGYPDFVIWRLGFEHVLPNAILISLIDDLLMKSKVVREALKIEEFRGFFFKA